jgi:hypothetical protein
MKIISSIFSLKAYLLSSEFLPLFKYNLNKVLFLKTGKLLFNNNFKNYTNDPISEKIINDLKTNGIATVQFEELFGNDINLNDIINDYNEFSKTEYFKDAIQISKSNIKKNFLIRSGSFNDTHTQNSSLLNTAISDKMLNIVSNYLETMPRLQLCEFWYTIPQGDKIPEQSQKWHRDPEDFKLIKVFLYLNEVDENAGPFTYLRQSHGLGRFGNTLKRKLPTGPFYPDENEIFKLIDKGNIQVNTGSLGTMIFCDTYGFHKGGDAKTNPRIFAYWTFSTPSTLFKISFKPLVNFNKLKDFQRFVLGK